MRHAICKTLLPVTLLSVLPALTGCNLTNNGSTIDSDSNKTLATLPANTALTLTAHQGLEAATVGKDATGTLTLSTIADARASAVTTADGFNLTLPDNNTVSYSAASGHSDLVATQTYRATVKDGTNTVETTLTNGAESPLTYSTYGVWAERDKSATLTSVGAIAMGIPTAIGKTPVSGSANYSGNISGFVSNGANTSKITGGTVSLIANFADKTISGTVTNIATQALDGTATGQINNLFLNAGKITDNTFAGTAVAAAAGATTTMDISAAKTGAFGGRFYGPDAAETAGSIALSGGGTALLASFGAKK